MERAPQGYLHEKLDVKVLILFILARIDTPLSAQELYEVAYQDDSLNYFTFAECLPEMVASGHLQASPQGRYSITEKGRAQGAQVEDSLAVPVVQKVSAAIDETKTRLLREGCVTTTVTRDPQGAWIATLNYRDGDMPIMTLQLMAPSEATAHTMAQRLRSQAAALYQFNLDTAIGDEGSLT